MAKSKLFSSALEPACEYCKFGTVARGNKMILCIHSGVVQPYGSCKKFLYAPLKRIPKRPNQLPEYDPSDFEL